MRERAPNLNARFRGGFLVQVSHCDPNVRNVHKGNNGIKLLVARMRFWRGTGQSQEPLAQVARRDAATASHSRVAAVAFEM